MHQKKCKHHTQRPGFLGEGNKNLSKEIVIFENRGFLLLYYLMKAI